MILKKEHKPLLIVLMIIGLIMLAGIYEDENQIPEKKEGTFGMGRFLAGGFMVVVGIAATLTGIAAIPGFIMTVTGFSLMGWGVGAVFKTTPTIPPWIYIGGFIVLIVMLSKKK